MLSNIRTNTKKLEKKNYVCLFVKQDREKPHGGAHEKSYDVESTNIGKTRSETGETTVCAISQGDPEGI